MAPAGSSTKTKRLRSQLAPLLKEASPDPTPPSTKPGQLRPAEQRAQASLIMMERMFGKDRSIAALADRFGMSERSIDRRLALARADGVPGEAREIFIREMLPQSMAVLQEALLSDDLDLAVKVAVKVVEGLRAMELVSGAGTGPGVEETLEAWKVRRTVRRVDEPGPASVATALATAAEGVFEEASPRRDESVPLPLGLAPGTEAPAPDPSSDSPRPLPAGDAGRSGSD